MKMMRTGVLVVGVLLLYNLSMIKGDCPSGWNELSGRNKKVCVRLSTNRTTWDKANETCTSQNARLLQIPDDQTLVNLRDKYLGEVTVWISMITGNGTDYVWVPDVGNKISSIFLDKLHDHIKQPRKVDVYFMIDKTQLYPYYSSNVHYNSSYTSGQVCEYINHPRTGANGPSTQPKTGGNKTHTTKISGGTHVPNPTTTAPSETGSAHATNQDNNQQLVLILIVAGAGVVVLAVVVIAVVCFFKCRETKQKTECVTQQDETKPAEQQASSIEDDGRVVSDEGLVYVTVAHAQSKRKPGSSAQPEVKQDGEDDGRVVTEDGLVYVTVAHAQGKQKPGKPTQVQNPQEDKVEYAAIGSCTTATIHNP